MDPDEGRRGRESVGEGMSTGYTLFFSYFLLGAYFFSTAPGKATDKDVFYSFSKEAGNGRV